MTQDPRTKLTTLGEGGAAIIFAALDVPFAFHASLTGVMQLSGWRFQREVLRDMVRF
jgi:hypothetical protein